MKILDIARDRVSIRNYKSSIKPPLSDVLYCLETANESPSGLNCQPWYFIIISSKDVKVKIRRLCESKEKEFHNKISRYFKDWLDERGITWRKPFLEYAPYLIIVLGNIKCPYFVQSTWLSIGYLLLACEEKGLSTLTYTPPNTYELSEVLDVPKGFKIEAIIPVGFKSEDRNKEPRIPLREKIFIDKWGMHMNLEK